MAATLETGGPKRKGNDMGISEKRRVNRLLCPHRGFVANLLRLFRSRPRGQHVILVLVFDRSLWLIGLVMSKGVLSDMSDV